MSLSQKNREKSEWGKEKGMWNIGHHEFDQGREDLKYEMWKKNWQEKPWNVRGKNSQCEQIEWYENKERNESEPKKRTRKREKKEFRLVNQGEKKCRKSV